MPCDRCHFIDIRGLDPAAVLASLWNVVNADKILRGWAVPMTRDQARAHYDAAKPAGGDFVGFRRIDYLEFTPMKLFINDEQIETLNFAHNNGSGVADHVVAALRAGLAAPDRGEELAEKMAP